MLVWDSSNTHAGMVWYTKQLSKQNCQNHKALVVAQKRDTCSGDHTNQQLSVQHSMHES